MTAAALAEKTLAETIAWSTHCLRETGIETAALDARLLVLAAAGLSLERYLADPDVGLSDTALARANAFIARRARREPVAHILEEREFFGRMFRAGPAALVPRPDSETLIEAVLAQVDRRAALRVLDLGTGTGCLLLTLLAECPEAEGVGVDRSEEALVLAAENARSLGLASRARFLLGHWTGAIAGPFDIILSNPPYIPSAVLTGLEPEVRDYEPRLALDGGSDGLDAYRAILSDMERLLVPGGLVALELGVEVAADVAGMLQNRGFDTAEVTADLAGRPRVAIARNRAF